MVARVRTTYADLEALSARGFTFSITGGYSEEAPQGDSGERENRHKSGYREDLGIYVRSGWEANWCRYLNWLLDRNELKAWQYEPDEFEFPVKRGPARFYKPDYKLWLIGGKTKYQEVKGYMDPVSATKLKRMQKYYPEVEVEVIGRQIYRDIEKALGKIIPHWEFD